MKLPRIPDLELATETMSAKGLRLVLAKDRRVIYASTDAGLAPYLQAIRHLGVSIRGASLADKTAGSASALLTAYADIKAVFAETISDGAVAVFERNRIPFRYEKRVPAILDRKMAAQCPFERVVSGVSDPKAAFLLLAKSIDRS